MEIPAYTKDTVYQELIKICESAGSKIIYTKINDKFAGRTNKFDCIEMPGEYCFKSDETATKVLAHELGHCLCENSSATYLKAFENLIDAAKQYSEVDKFLDQCEELICDLVGEFLYALAERIATRGSDG